MLGFNDTSTLLGHFMSYPREKKKRNRRYSREDEREEQGKLEQVLSGGHEYPRPAPLFNHEIFFNQ